MMHPDPHPFRFPRVVRYRFVARALTPIELPAYAGSAWRGLLGGSLRRTACTTRSPDCGGCLVAGNCAFFQLFETPAPRPDTPRGQVASHPFVLDLDAGSPRTLQPGDGLGLGVTLIGDANGLLPNLVYAMIQAGEAGLGRGRGRFRLEQVLQERSLSLGDWGEVFDARVGTLTPFEAGPINLPGPPPGVLVDLITPLRIKRFGRLVGTGEFGPADFLRTLCRRLDALDHQFGEGSSGGLCEHHWGWIANLAPSNAHLRWLDWPRYSSRQGTGMQLGGLVGTFDLPAGVVAALWPLLWLGQWVHVGKSTSFGLGAYRLRAGPEGPLPGQP